jgi:uncharacterized membrane protein
MSTTPPPDEPTGAPEGPPPSGPDHGAPPPPRPDYGAPPPSGPDYGAPAGGYGTPPPTNPYGTPYASAEERWSVGDALGYGWRKFTQNVGPILVLTLVVLLGSFVLGIVGSVLDRAVFGTSGDGAFASNDRNVFSSLLGFLGQAFFGAVIVRAALDLTEGRALDIGGIFRRIPFGPVVVLAIVVAVIETIGFILLVIPGLVAILFLYFATFFLLDHRPGPLEAVRSSVRLVARDLGKALVWAIVAFLVTLVGFCFCLVGAFVTFPVATIGTAYTYKKLTGQPVAP